MAQPLFEDFSNAGAVDGIARMRKTTNRYKYIRILIIELYSE
jgi:hypothetical protein